MLSRLRSPRVWIAAVRSASAQAKNGTGVVLLNMGGPANTDDVHDFLLRLFSDRDLMRLPAQSISSRWIAKRRTPKIQAQYKEIGGGSPIGSWTRQQGEALCSALDEVSPATAPHLPFTGFRYVHPLTGEAIDAVEESGVARAIAFTQYPQYSCSTTGSSLNELARVYHNRKQKPGVKWSVIDRWHSHPLLLSAFAEILKDELAQFPEELRGKVVILFSAHSLPLDVVNRGDPYTAEVAATVNGVMTALGFTNPYRLVWQSRVGPSAWQGPATDDVMKQLASHPLLVVPIAFVNDHIETLYELDKEYCGELAEKYHIAHVRRAPSLNLHPTFIRALTAVATEHMSHGWRPTTQFAIRCPGCDNDDCSRMRHFFRAQLHHHEE